MSYSSASADAAKHLAALTPHLWDAGITRIGDLTGLDVLDIPVAFAARPNSRTLSVTQGKSLCAVEARLGAVMEALEHAFAERTETLVACRASKRALGARGVAFADLARCKRSQQAPGDDRVVAWSEATSLVSGRRVLVPYELVGLDMRAEAGAGVDMRVVSGLGLAAAPTRDAAATHALLEVIEHNATASLDMFGFLIGLARPVLHRTGSDPALDKIAARIAAAGLSYRLFDLSSPGGLPVIGALLDCPDLVPGWIQFAGFACRFSPEHAAEAALLEAVQSRLTQIAGARDDLKASDYRGAARSSPVAPIADLHLDQLPHDDAELRHAPPRARLLRAVAAARAVGADDILAVTLGAIPGVASVVRVIATDVEASGFKAVTFLGRRTLDALLAGAEPDR